MPMVLSGVWQKEEVSILETSFLTRMAMERIVSYFITDIEIGGDTSDDEKTKYSDFLNKQFAKSEVIYC